MNRRKAILAVTALAAGLAHAPAWAAPAEEEDREFSAFTALSKAMLALINSTKPLADLIDRDRFYYFLIPIQGLLVDLITSKRQVLDGLTYATCQGDDRMMVQAREATQEVRDLLPRLSKATSDLSKAVKPADLSAGVMQAADAMAGVGASKGGWVRAVQGYCSADRTAIRERVQTSLALAIQCRKDLDALIAKLHP